MVRPGLLSRWFLALAAFALMPSGARALDTVRVGLPVADDISFFPVFAAEELGLYAANGIKAEITIYRGAGASEEALAADAADVVNLIPSGVAVAVAKGVPEQIVACGPQTAPDGWHMLALAKGPIRSLKDLDGGKVGVSSKNSTTDFYALWAARHAGVTFQTIPLGGSEIAGLRGGQVQAIVRSSAQSLELLTSGEARSVVDYKAAMEPNMPECWAAGAGIIRDRPAAIRGFVHALIEATRRMQSDRAYGMGLLRKTLDDKSEVFLDAAYDRVVKTLATSDTVDLAALENSLDLAALAGIGNLPPAEKLVAGFAMPAAAGGK